MFNVAPLLTVMMFDCFFLLLYSLWPFSSKLTVPLLWKMTNLPSSTFLVMPTVLLFWAAAHALLKES